MSDTSRPANWRRLTGPANWIATGAAALPVVLAALWALEVQNWFGLLVYKEQFLAVMLACGLVTGFLNVKARRGEAVER